MKKILLFNISWISLSESIEICKTINTIENDFNIDFLVIKNEYKELNTKEKIITMNKVILQKPKIIKYENLLKKTANKVKGKILYLDGNYGYTIASNVALKYAKDNNYEYTISSNADIVYDQKIIERLIINSETLDATIIAPAINEAYKSKNKFVNKGHMISKFTGSSYFFLKPSKISDSFYKVDCVTGCFFLIRTKQLNSFYLPYIFAFTDEADLMLRIKKNKKKVIIDTSIKINHLTGNNIAIEDPFRLYLYSRNILILCANHFLIYFPISVVFHSIRVFKNILLSKYLPEQKYYIMKGHFDGLKIISKIFLRKFMKLIKI